MREEKKQIEIGKIEFDEEIYPRNQVDWLTTVKYKGAMQAGAQFPRVVIGFFDSKYYLVDGAHRLEAYKQRKLKTIPAIIRHYVSKNEMYLDAVKANSTHGRPFSQQERARIALRLKDLQVSQLEIAQLISVRAEDVKKFVADRVSYVNVAGQKQEVILKAPLKDTFAGKEITTAIEDAQDVFAARHQEQILNEVITLLETKSLDTGNEGIMEKITRIQELIEELI